MDQQYAFLDEIRFRSGLERIVAQELVAHDVDFQYEEKPFVLEDGSGYLPDFTIHAADDELMLPTWVEVKPQEMIYDLFQALGLARKHGERFSGVVFDQTTSSGYMKRALQIAELWKPKALAEAMNLEVLVLGRVGGTSTLSVTMSSDYMMFSRSHPFVNWPGYRKKVERQAKEEQWRRDREEAQRRAEAWRVEEETRRAERSERERQRLASLVKGTSPRTTRFSSRCRACPQMVPEGSLGLYGGPGDWVPLCAACREALGR